MNEYFKFSSQQVKKHAHNISMEVYLKLWFKPAACKLSNSRPKSGAQIIFLFIFPKDNIMRKLTFFPRQ